MATRLNAYLSFRDDARAAMTFYQSVFGGELTMNTFAEFAMPGVAQGDADKIMHAQLVGENGVEFMGADTPESMPYDAGSRISMSLFGEDDTTLSAYFDALAEGGATTMPLAQAPWGSKFGMCVDKFGVAWMVNIDQQS